MGTAEQRTRNATLFDVARLAGVSHQTVSRVLNSHPNVREATRERVLAAVKQLRYRPNVAARVMANRQSRTIGLVTTGSPDYGPSSTVLGFTSAARQARYSVTISTAADAEPESLRASVDLLLGQQVEAVVVVASRTRMLIGLDGNDFGVPVIVVEPTAQTSIPSVSIDQYAGAVLAVGHLIGLGHRDIVHISGPGDSMDATERVRAWRDTMAEHGLVARPPLEGDWTPASGYRLGTQVAESRSPFTAVFSANDQMALGCLHALRQHALPVPADVSLIGLDDIPAAEHFQPPLTAMRQDFTLLGEGIMALVLNTLTDQSPVGGRHVP